MVLRVTSDVRLGKDKLFRYRSRSCSTDVLATKPGKSCNVAGAEWIGSRFGDKGIPG